MRFATTLGPLQDGAIFFFFIWILSASIVVVKAQENDPSLILSELYLRPSSGQLESFVELYNPTNQRLPADNTQLCQGSLDNCMQLKGSIDSGSYVVVCADISMNPYCTQALDYVLTGNDPIVLRNSILQIIETSSIENNNDALVGVSYSRLTTTNEGIVTFIPSESITPGYGFVSYSPSPSSIFTPDACAESFCSRNSICINDNSVSFGYTCTCKNGFSGNGRVCLEIDECALEDYPCAPVGSFCVNTEGSYECSCIAGFTGNGFECVDIDECTVDNNPCASEGSVCINTVGSYECSCIEGFSGDGFECADIDECLVDYPCAPQVSVCVNTVGSYECACTSGWKGNGIFCKDINECRQEKDDCGQNTVCVNEQGSFRCDCIDNDIYFQQNNNKKECKRKCAHSSPCSSEGSSCKDLEKGWSCTCKRSGSYECSCGNGWKGNGRFCRDIDECRRDKDDCGQNTVCVNSQGSFSCDCINDTYEKVNIFDKECTKKTRRRRLLRQ